MPHTLTVDFKKPIRLFPLGQCLLLPHTTIPLHIFEKRYRAMTRDALDHDGLIAMAVLNREDQALDSRPPIHPHVCIGYIVHHEHLPGGRYNMLLQGIARAQIHEELDLHPDGYRQAILRPTEHPVAEFDLNPQREKLQHLLNDKHLKQLAALRNISHWLSPDLSTPTIIDLTWQAASRDAQQRYDILAEPCVFKRCEQLCHHLTQTRQTLALAEQMGECTSETGLPLN